MDKPWYRNLFASNQHADGQSIRSRAEAGSAEAQFYLGLKFAAIEGATQDKVQAAAWYAKAADQSHPLAQFNLGVMYAQGEGVERDEAKAFALFEQAARQGDAGAQFNLGMRQHRASGDSTTSSGDAAESKVEAYKWFSLSAAQGYRGSDAAFERIALTMSHEEVADGARRAASFPEER